VFLSNVAPFAGPFDFDTLVPADKKLDPAWVQSLTARGQPEIFRGRDLRFIGMPVGGIGCGQLYIGGQGQLWHWDIFQPRTPTDDRIWTGPRYAKPLEAVSQIDHGFALQIKQHGRTTVRTLDQKGFSQISFRGEYPMARVQFEDPQSPVQVALEAFSPFIPLNLDDSSLPATVLNFTIVNTSRTPVELTFAGWLENAVCPKAKPGTPLERHTGIRTIAGGVSLVHAARPEKVAQSETRRPDILFADFEQDDYGNWKTEATAFGGRPYRKSELPPRQTISGAAGERLVNSHNSRAGENSEQADAHTGKLISPQFSIERRYIRFLIGGGNHPGQTGLQLVIDGKAVRQATGENSNAMRPEWFDVREFAGRAAQLEIIDLAKGGWGHTTVDQIVFSDAPPEIPPEAAPGFGSMALTLLGSAKSIRGITRLQPRVSAAALFAELRHENRVEAAGPLDWQNAGAICKTTTLEPGAKREMTFVVSWWFPFYAPASGEMAAIADIHQLRRRYARRFSSALAAAEYVSGNIARLSRETKLWNRTWYDSSLPYWFLDRCFVTSDTLATQTLHAFDNGRFWGWEGVDCCAGTCQHVWQYAQAAARLFPQIERDLRERVDFGLAWHDTGAMDYRAENSRMVAHDGFCGTIVRVYREHEMSPDSAFLRRLWPRVRKSLEFIMSQDRDDNGLLEGEQMNTLDAAWYGPMGWISSLYLAALAAGEAMAREMDDADMAGRCRTILDRGRKNLVAELFNGEYFIHRPPDFKHTNTNNGCHIDQVLGQSFAWQVGLPRVAPETETRTALQSLWKYNFAPDVGRYRDGMKGTIPNARWYAMPGEAGLLMCAWPKGGAEHAAGGGNPTFVGYFIECMTGFEYQVAAHMIWERMITEGLAITRAIHDRYHPAKRNPYNEIECSDHYSRAMMSYGAFLAACGFEYHGPQKHIGFAPRIAPENFRAAFTAAEGWGAFSQTRTSSGQQSQIELKWGELRLRTLALELPAAAKNPSMTVKLGRKTLSAPLEMQGTRAVARFTEDVLLKQGEALRTRFRW